MERTKIIYCFFKVNTSRNGKRTLKLWSLELANKSIIEKDDNLKIDIKTMLQTKDYIYPLFKMLKKKDLDKEIENRLFNIVRYLREKEYIKANDEYLGICYI